MKIIYSIIFILISLAGISQDSTIFNTKHNDGSFGKPKVIYPTVYDSGLVAKTGNHTPDTIVCRGCLLNTPAALTKIDDANVTLTLGGTPATSLLQATSLTLGWTGSLSIARGGTNNGSLSVTNQNLLITDGSKVIGLAKGTNGQHLIVNGSGNLAFVDSSAGGGGTPAGSDGYIQYNNSGAFGASANLFWDKTKFWLGINGTPTIGTTIFQSSYYKTGTAAVTSGSPTITFSTADPRNLFSIGEKILINGESKIISALTATTATATTNFIATFTGTYSNSTLSTGILAAYDNGNLFWHGSKIYGTDDSLMISSDPSSISYGYTAFRANTGLSAQSVAIGAYSLYKANTASANTAVGFEALYAATGGSSNTAIGSKACDSCTANGNVAVGASALQKNTADYNTAVGYQALQVNTIGAGNVAVGKNALNLNTTGGANTALGFGAGGANTTGSYGTFIGNGAGASSNTPENTFVGYNSGSLATGYENSMFGAHSGELTVAGKLNSFYGYASGANNTSGNFNVAIGGYVNVPVNSTTGQGNYQNVLYIKNGYQTESASSTPTATGSVGIGVTSASVTARLMLPAGTATASTSPLKFTSGTSLTTAEAGSMEYDGTNLFFTPTGTIRKVVPTNVAGRSTAQTAAVGTVVTQTVGAADASYRVSANVLVTTSSAENFTVTVAYTDESNTARTLTLNFQTIAGVIGTTVAFANGAVPYEGIVTHIRCKATTTITIATAAGGTYTGCTYNVEGSITQIN